MPGPGWQQTMRNQKLAAWGAQLSHVRCPAKSRECKEESERDQGSASLGVIGAIRCHQRTMMLVTRRCGHRALVPTLPGVSGPPPSRALTSTRCGATRLQQRITWSRGLALLRTILSMASPRRNRCRALLRSWVDFTSPTRRQDHKSHQSQTQKWFDLSKHG